MSSLLGLNSPTSKIEYKPVSDLILPELTNMSREESSSQPSQRDSKKSQDTQKKFKQPLIDFESDFVPLRTFPVNST